VTQYGWRGADAVDAAVAQQAGCTVISLGQAHLTRLGSMVTGYTPSAVLAELVPPTSPASPVCPPDLCVFADHRPALWPSLLTIG
jgi:hypothetical protein